MWSRVQVSAADPLGWAGRSRMEATMFRLLLLLSLLAPTGCRTKDDTGDDTSTPVVETADTQDTAGPDGDGDGYGAGLDCDDTDASVHPGQDETPYDGVDNDCDETTPDDDLDGDGVLEAEDCDDEDPEVHPDATESCNDIDDDCNGEIDDAVGELWFADDDEDGFGDPDVSTQDCDGATGFVADATDCNDGNASVNPGEAEVCDGLDNDCDLLVDDDDPDLADPTDWYGDLDEDGWGDPANHVAACVGPSQFVRDADDCDDTDAAVNPDAQEICNEVDDDCDGLVDVEDDSIVDLTTYYSDLDGDGYGTLDDTVEDCEAPSGYADNPDDCNDDEPLAWPGANETCNELDDDCDGDIDEASASDAGLWYLDDDADGYGDAAISVASCEGDAGYVADDTDCDDTDPAVNPGETEVCNGTDDDCDTLIDDDDPDVADMSTFYVDDDGDGYGDASVALVACELPSGAADDDTDCDDTASEVHPDATELCNGTDDDCDTLVDDDDPDVADQDTWYLDFDGDGYGNSSFTVDACEVPSGYVDNDDDCEDAYPEASPVGTEVCDNLDNDCDGTVDDDATDASTWYGDADGDGYGDASSVTVDCAAPSDGVAEATDCDDTDAAVNPGATEVCNGVDDDCDGDTDDDDAGLDTSTASTWYADDDSDGYGDPSDDVQACESPAGYGADASDCDDTDGAVHPGGTEVCDDVDNDCDGQVDGDDGDLSLWSCFGTGADGTVSTGSLDLNRDATGSRTAPDGVAWQVTSDVSGTSLVLESTTGLAAGDLAILFDAQGSQAGAWDLVRIETVSAAGVTLLQSPGSSYGTASADVILLQRVPQYESLTITSTLTASAWDGLSSGASTGRATGVVAVMVDDTFQVQSGATVRVSELGFGGAATGAGPESPFGEVTAGGEAGSDGGWADGGAGGGTASSSVSGGDGASSCSNGGGPSGLGGGGGGGKITHCAGGSPVTGGGGGGGAAAYDAGATESTSDLSALTLGGGASAGAGGGESGANYDSGTTVGPGGSAAGGDPGGAGGGIVLIWADSLVIDGTVTASGGHGGDGGDGESKNGGGSDDGGGGGGEGGQGASGGTILLAGNTLTLATSSVSALGGGGGDGGEGGAGYSTSTTAGGSGAAAGGTPTSGAAGSYAGDGGAPGGGGAGGEAGAVGIIRVEAGEVNGYAYGTSDAESAVDDATSGDVAAFAEFSP